MEEHFIEARIKARYYTIGNLSNSIKNVWIVCHGYGQLAKYFIKKFESLEADHTLIIAPEGLSRFYQDGFSGKIGAAWMTKENRHIEIENYISYLNLIYESLTPLPENVCFNVLGFSQGTATVCRWVLHQNFKVNNLLLWAGEFPPDIDKNLARSRFSSLNTYLIFGSKDPFIDKNIVNIQIKRIEDLNHKPQLIEFEGAHDISQDALDQIIELIGN